MILPATQFPVPMIFWKYWAKYPPFGALEEAGGDDGTAANTGICTRIPIPIMRVFLMRGYRFFIYVMREK